MDGLANDLQDTFVDEAEMYRDDADKIRQHLAQNGDGEGLEMPNWCD